MRKDLSAKALSGSVSNPLVKLGRKPLLTCATALPVMLSAALPAWAQPAERSFQLEEVIVTATRKDESMQDVATSITALGADALAAQGITDFSEVKRLTAGLHMEAPQNLTTAALRIRGVGSAGNSTVDPSVGVLVDGVYLASPGAAFMEMLDVERVEVLRGPQGTLFGKNTTAGVFHIHTKDPVMNELSGKVQGVVGNLGAQELRGVVNLPLIDDTLAMRVSAFKAERDGYTQNTFLGEDTRDEEREGGRIKLRWTPTDNLDITWLSETLQKESRQDEAVTAYGNDISTSRLPGVSGEPLSDLAQMLGKELPPVSLGESADNGVTVEDEVQRHVLTVNWILENHTLQSITAYEETDTYANRDRDRSILELSRLVSDAQREHSSQELILSSEFEGPLNYLIGGFYQTEKVNSETSIYTLEDAITLGAAAAPPTLSLSTWDNEVQAVFGSVTYNATNDLSFTLGSRYTEETKDILSELVIPGLPVISPVDSEKTFRETTYSFKTKYHLDDDRMVYFSYDKGFKSGGFNRQGSACLLASFNCLNENDLNYDPETTDSYEVGLKSTWWDNRLRLNGAIFYQTYDGYQVSQPLLTQGVVVVSNAAEVESKGIEMDLSAALTERLTLDLSAAYIDARYDQYSNAPCATTSEPGCATGEQDLSGELLDNSPLWSGNAGVEYRMPWDHYAGVEVFMRADASYRSETNLDSTQSDATVQSGYTLYSARLGVEGNNGDWRLTLWGKNLTDESYATYALKDDAGVTAFEGMPRTWGLTADWSF